MFVCHDGKRPEIWDISRKVREQLGAVPSEEGAAPHAMQKLVVLSLVCQLLAPAFGLQLTGGHLGARQASLTPRLTTGPRLQFGGEPERKGLTRDTEPEEFFKTNMGDYAPACNHACCGHRRMPRLCDAVFAV